MKKWSGILIVGVVLLASVACAGQAAAPANPTDSPTAGAGSSAGPTSIPDAAQPPALAPTAPTDIPIPTATPTPEPLPQWVWAWTMDPPQIVAVSTTGVVNVLMDAPDPTSLNTTTIRQVAPDKALVVYYADGQTSAYLLTTTEAIQLPLPPLQLEAPENGWDVVAHSGPYVVIRHFYGYSQPAFLINIDMAEISLVANDVVDFDNAVTFSADNHYMRYVTTDANSGTMSQVTERDLTTGQERTLYSYSNFDHVFSDATGDLWYDVRTGDLIAADGTPTNSQRDIRANVFRWLVGDYFMTGDYACAQDCLLTLTPIFGDGPSLTFTLPEKDENYGVAGWLLPDGSLLAYNFGSRDLWHLGTDSSGDLLGYRDAVSNYTFRSFSQHWIWLMDSQDAETASALLDIHTGDTIPFPETAGSGDFYSSDPYPGGILWTLYRADNSTAYWLLPDDSDTFIPAPDLPANTYCDHVLPDGNLVCSQVDEASGASSLLLLDMASGQLAPFYQGEIYTQARPVP